MLLLATHDLDTIPKIVSDTKVMSNSCYVQQWSSRVTVHHIVWVDWIEIVSSQDKEDASQGMPAGSGSSELTDGSSTQHAFFSKYDVVEKYLKGKGYPPGLTSVEKNTFRRLCSRFAIHGEGSMVDEFLL